MNVIDYLQDIKVPTLIFFGENDNDPESLLESGTYGDIANYGASKFQTTN